MSVSSALAATSCGGIRTCLGTLAADAAVVRNETMRIGGANRRVVIDSDRVADVDAIEVGVGGDTELRIGRVTRLSRNGYGRCASGEQGAAEEQTKIRPRTSLRESGPFRMKKRVRSRLPIRHSS